MRNPSDSYEPAVGSKRHWLDFWVLVVAATAALVSAYFSIFGFYAELHKLRTFAYVGGSTLIATLMAAIAVRLSYNRDGLPLLPIFESCWGGSLNVRNSLYPLVVALVLGIVGAYDAIAVWHVLDRWISDPALATTHPMWSARPSISSILLILRTAILEEILFRAVIFASLSAGLNWIWKRLFLRAKSMPIWIANVIQALAFSEVHLALGVAALYRIPWYLLLVIVPQAWGASPWLCLLEIRT